MRKIIILSLCLCLLMETIPVYASNSIETVESETYNGTSNDETKSSFILTNAMVSSEFTVMISKKIVLDGATQSAEYNVSVTGDISGDERIIITPDATIKGWKLE